MDENVNPVNVRSVLVQKNHHDIKFVDVFSFSFQLKHVLLHLLEIGCDLQSEVKEKKLKLFNLRRNIWSEHRKSYNGCNLDCFKGEEEMEGLMMRRSHTRVNL